MMKIVYVVHICYFSDGKGAAIPTKQQSESLTKAMDKADTMANDLPSNITVSVVREGHVLYEVNGRRN